MPILLWDVSALWSEYCWLNLIQGQNISYEMCWETWSGKVECIM